MGLQHAGAHRAERRQRTALARPDLMVVRLGRQLQLVRAQHALGGRQQLAVGLEGVAAREEDGVLLRRQHVLHPPQHWPARGGRLEHDVEARAACACAHIAFARVKGTSTKAQKPAVGSHLRRPQ